MTIFSVISSDSAALYSVEGGKSITIEHDRASDRVCFQARVLFCESDPVLLDSPKDALQKIKEDNGKNGTSRQSNQPGHENSTNNSEIKCSYTSSQPYSQNSSHQSMGSGYWHTCSGCQNHYRSSSQFSRKTPARCQLCNM